VTITIIRSGTVITGDARTSLPDTDVVPVDGVVRDLPHSDPDRSFGQADLIVAMASSHIADAIPGIAPNCGRLGPGAVADVVVEASSRRTGAVSTLATAPDVDSVATAIDKICVPVREAGARTRSSASAAD
jgi:hypothetical protein